MPRYFLEVAYKGTHFSGFQLQPKGQTIQGEINIALATILKEEIVTTPSSRTDAGVHALQNYLHFDTEQEIAPDRIYNLNAILDRDIMVKDLFIVEGTAHARFDALSRKYSYHILQARDPFLRETTYFMPFKLDHKLMEEGAALIMTYQNFESFAKKKTDVKTFECRIMRSAIEYKEDTKEMIYHVEANRFLRGMVRALTGTLIQLGRKKINLAEFEEIILSRDCTRADFSVPAQGLFLEQVRYPQSLFRDKTNTL